MPSTCCGAVDVRVLPFRKRAPWRGVSIAASCACTDAGAFFSCAYLDNCFPDCAHLLSGATAWRRWLAAISGRADGRLLGTSRAGERLMFAACGLPPAVNSSASRLTALAAGLTCSNASQNCSYRQADEINNWRRVSDCWRGAAELPAVFGKAARDYCSGCRRG